MRKPPTRRAKTPSAPKRVSVRVEFVGGAADAIEALLRRGLHGPTLQLVVEGLALAELRRQLPAPTMPIAVVTSTGSADKNGCKGPHDCG